MNTMNFINKKAAKYYNITLSPDILLLRFILIFLYILKIVYTQQLY